MIIIYHHDKKHDDVINKCVMRFVILYNTLIFNYFLIEKTYGKETECDDTKLLNSRGDTHFE